jgi:hypothetical protein
LHRPHRHHHEHRSLPLVAPSLSKNHRKFRIQESAQVKSFIETGTSVLVDERRLTTAFSW